MTTVSKLTIEELKCTLKEQKVLLGIDIETTGLDGRTSPTTFFPHLPTTPQESVKTSLLPGAVTNKILSIAIKVLDCKLSPVWEEEFVIHYSKSELADMDEWCRNTHEKSGLLNQVRESKMSLLTVESLIMDRLHTLGITNYNRKLREGCIMFGSSMHFDRAFIKAHMPVLDNFCHYRQLDVSSIAIFLDLLYPKREQFKKKMAHTALADINETTDELVSHIKWIKGF